VIRDDDDTVLRIEYVQIMSPFKEKNVSEDTKI